MAIRQMLTAFPHYISKYYTAGHGPIAVAVAHSRLKIAMLMQVSSNLTAAFVR